MGPNTSREPGGYVGQLADHARLLQRQARDAMARGDYARAAALIGDAELLAGDVHGLVDEIENRETYRLIGHAAVDARVKMNAQARSDRRSTRRLRFAIGASLAISLALVEC